MMHHAYHLTEAQGAVALNDDAAAVRAIKNKLPVWVHLDGNAEQITQWLHTTLPALDTLIVEELLEQATRPSAEYEQDGVLLILRGINYNDDAQPEDMVSLRAWCQPNLLITVQRRNLRAVGDVVKHVTTTSTEQTSPADCLVHLCKRLTYRMEPTITRIAEELDHIEEMQIDSPEAVDRQRVVTLRKQIIMIRRYVSPQRDAFTSLIRDNDTLFSPQQIDQIERCYSMLIRYVEELDALRERAVIIQDELANFMSNRLNHNMYVLSIITAVFLPLGFITGLLGINVGGMPGAESDAAFWIVVAGLCALVASQVYYFRKKRWL